MRGITKRFPGVLADDNVDLLVSPGEIHALMGENGAGKSILMSMLAGLYQPDEGEIFIRGVRHHFSSPIEAMQAGIGMVFQEFQLFKSMTIAENIIFGQEPTKRAAIDMRKAKQDVLAISQKYGLDINPSMLVSQAPVGVLQRVEIVKALYRDANILILDEPTAVLTPQETVGLFEVLRNLKQDGRTIIFITHKLNEVMEISDTVTVLRDGKVTARMATSDTTPEAISRYMTGRDVDLTMQKPSEPPGDPVLQITNLTAYNDQGTQAVNDVSLTVRKGEIVGVAGVAGNGQAELIQTIIGLRNATSGQITINNIPVESMSIHQRRSQSLAYIPEDRRGVGTALEASAEHNVIMGYQYDPPIRPKRTLNRRAIRKFATDLISEYDVKIASPTTHVGTLSGGNVQKLVVAREMHHYADVLIAEQPTRGVDIGSIEFIHTKLVEYRDAGRAILLVSAELSEIMSLASRIVVMFEGSIVAELDPATVTEEEIGLYMAGSKRQTSTGVGSSDSSDSTAERAKERNHDS